MNLSRFALVSAVSMVALVPVTGAEAVNLVTSNFEVTIDSGDLLGNTYTGSFSYDLDETPTPNDPNPLFAEFNTRDLKGFNFDFENTTYTDILDGEANFDLVTGDFLGLTYNEPTVSFSFNTGFDFDVFDFVTTFTTTNSSGLFTLSTATTPEPSLLLGIGVMGAGLLFGKKKNNK